LTPLLEAGGLLRPYAITGGRVRPRQEEGPVEIHGLARAGEGPGRALLERVLDGLRRM
jgi:hypothetical protein